MLVRCERCGYEFNAEPRAYSYRREYAEQDGYRYPVQIINCTRCGRGYFQEIDGTWMSDRPLTVLEEGHETV